MNAWLQASLKLEIREKNSNILRFKEYFDRFIYNLVLGT
jgi:hypothetical protein